MQELFIVFFVEIKNEMGIWSTLYNYIFGP